MTNPDGPPPSPNAEDLEFLQTEGRQLINRMTAVNHALNLMGHAMSCGRTKTQQAAYDELLDAFAEMTSAWNARSELASHGIQVEQEDQQWGEEHG